MPNLSLQCFAPTNPTNPHHPIAPICYPAYSPSPDRLMTVTAATSAVCEPVATYGVSSPQYVEVLVDSPGSVDKLFTYGLPADL